MNAPRAFLLTLSGVVVTACSSAARPATPVATAVPTRIVRSSVMIGESFSPRTDSAAIAAFVPEIAPFDSGGECSVMPTGGNGATVVSVGFPNLANSRTRMGITFDSSGRAVRFFDRRGVTASPMRFGPEVTAAARDSAVRAAIQAVRVTTVSFDYVIDQAVVMNSGGGRPTEAVLGPVRSFENLERLGPPRARIERLRRLCGV